MGGGAPGVQVLCEGRQHPPFSPGGLSCHGGCRTRASPLRGGVREPAPLWAAAYCSHLCEALAASACQPGTDRGLSGCPGP